MNMPENGILPVSDNSHSWEIAPRAPCQQWETFKKVFFFKSNSANLLSRSFSVVRITGSAGLRSARCVVGACFL